MNTGNVIDYVINKIKEEKIEDIESVQDISAKLSELKDEEIIDYVGMADMPLLTYLMAIKYQDAPKVIPIENDLMIRIGECNLANFSYLALYLHFLKFDGNKLFLEGTTSTPFIIKDIKFGIKVNGSEELIETDSADYFDLKLGSNTYESRRIFRYEIDVNDDLEISFFNSVDNISVEYGRINAQRFCPIADVIRCQYYYDKGYVFYIKENKIICKRIADSCVNEYEEKYLKSIEENHKEKYEWVKGLREYFYNHKNEKPVILLMDRADKADDSARVFWEYLNTKDDVDNYFVLSEKSDEYNEMIKQGKVVPLYSPEHYKLALTADFVISSQCNGFVENPFWGDAEFFRDMYHRPKLIFLQHGVIKDDMSLTLNRFNTNFTGFLTSTEDEWKSILEYPYMYSKREVWNIGLPRFDRLENRRKRIILVMPTWRKDLMEQVWDKNTSNMVWKVKDNIRDSDFYKEYYALLNDWKFILMCKLRRYKILFCPHPLMKDYFTNSINKNVKVVDNRTSYRELFSKGALLITDYSSVAFDFLYLKKPVIYYQFDKESFFKSHTYRPGYFRYEDEVYGDVVTDVESLRSLVKKYMKSKCKLAPQHAKKIEMLFKRDNTHCQVLYKKLMGEK